MSQQLNLWVNSYQSDEDSSLKGQFTSINFGLNSKVLLTKFAFAKDLGYNKNQEGIDIEFNVNGTTVKYISILNPEQDEKSYFKGVEVLDRNSEDFKNGLMEAAKTRRGVITHYLKAAGKTDADLQVLYSGILGWTDFLQKASDIVTASAVATKKPLDLFMQYQRSIKGTADKTYLEVPSSLVYGPFVTAHIPAVGGEWKAEHSWTEVEPSGETVAKTGLRYVDGVGNVHRFDRDENFMKSKAAFQQTKEGSVSGLPLAQAPTANTGNTW